MIKEEHWSEFWRLYMEALGYQSVACVSNSSSLPILGIAVQNYSSTDLYPPRFRQGREYLIAINGSNDRISCDASFITVNKLSGAFSNPLGTLRESLLPDDTISGQNNVSYNDNITFIYVDLLLDTEPDFLKELISSQGGRIHFFGSNDARASITIFPSLFDRFGTKAARELEDERALTAQYKAEIRILKDNLSAYENEYKSFGNRRTRQRSIDAWKKHFIQEILHKIGTLIADNKLLIDELLIENASSSSTLTKLEYLDAINLDIAAKIKFLEMRDFNKGLNKAQTSVFELNTDLKDTLARQNNTVFRSQITKMHNYFIDIDQAQFTDAILELHHNATYWMASKTNSKKKVYVSVAISQLLQNDESLQIRVTDDGPGIDDEKKDMIFLPGFTSRCDGTGTGLASVQKFLDDHRGEIQEIGRPGKGAEFLIRLPIVKVR